MGTVSTALTEEALSESLKKSIYESTSPEDAAAGCSGEKNDVKCSVCQVFLHHSFSITNFICFYSVFEGRRE
jgi:hypothetical protein